MYACRQCVCVCVCLVLSSVCSIRFFVEPCLINTLPSFLSFPTSQFSFSFKCFALFSFFCFVAKHFSQFYKLKQEGSLVMPLYHHRLLLLTMQTKLLFCLQEYIFFVVYKLTLNYLGPRTQLLLYCVFKFNIRFPYVILFLYFCISIVSFLSLLCSVWKYLKSYISFCFFVSLNLL